MSDVVGFFNPSHSQHVKAWLYKKEHGQWPLDFWKVIERLEKPPHYHAKIDEKMAMAWATHKCAKSEEPVDLNNHPILPASQMYRPPPARFSKMAPEQALCYEFIEEAEVFGWEVYPEYPESRFDMLLVAKDGCITSGVSPGAQIGVQAKMSLNDEVVAQIKEPLQGYKTGWKRPDYLCVLIPAKPHNNDGVRRRIETLRNSGVGVLWVYEEFRGHDNPHSIKRVNLGCSSLLGITHIVTGAKRIELPEHKIWVEPGVASPMPVTKWKIKAVKACIAMAKSGPKTAAEIKKEFGMYAQHWVSRGWLVATGKRGRSQLFILAHHESRPDIRYKEIYEMYKDKT